MSLETGETPLSVAEEPLLPVRMLNEFAYCPRLAYLEWVQGEFADSADTMEGRFHHQDGLEALSMVEQAPPDLILLDLLMPGMDGVEVLRQLRQREYTGGVIIITGSHDEERLDEAWAVGPQEVIGKPVDLEQLLTSIQLVLVCREC